MRPFPWCLQREGNILKKIWKYKEKHSRKERTTKCWSTTKYMCVEETVNEVQVGRLTKVKEFMLFRFFIMLRNSWWTGRSENIYQENQRKTKDEDLWSREDEAAWCNRRHIKPLWKPVFFFVSTDRHMYDVDMSATPRTATNKRPISILKKVDGAMCGPGGVKVFRGNHYYHFESPKTFVAARALPEQHRISLELFGCDH